ncbi:MAG: hypothetical protein K9G39_04200 [Chlorobium sp.]|uniref:hypothetical protein n=1 Tax=Chlorobium sp. TaxID=1095 RepID=UPI0025BC7130|nr:hypothetical protein [Chlorobium sp.]MCF8382785.1 hypothetical protein [Chlorobium sp.]
MTGEQNDTRNLPETIPSKPVEKTGFPPVPPRAAMDDLRFIIKESIRLGARCITELDRLLSELKK